jgi:hypothetical protein
MTSQLVCSTCSRNRWHHNSLVQRQQKLMTSQLTRTAATETDDITTHSYSGNGNWWHHHNMCSSKYKMVTSHLSTIGWPNTDDITVFEWWRHHKSMFSDDITCMMGCYRLSSLSMAWSCTSSGSMMDELLLDPPPSPRSSTPLGSSTPVKETQTPYLQREGSGGSDH